MFTAVTASRQKMRRARSEDLLFVLKSPKDRLDLLAAGASLVDRTGYAINELRKKAALDRIELAAAFLKDAQVAAQSNPPLNRTAISRSYYSMYHAIRAATFVSYGGDDHEQHTILPSKIPNDFPEHAKWQNKLKNARLERNRADYDPYPRRDSSFKESSEEILSSAALLLIVAQTYIRSK